MRLPFSDREPECDNIVITDSPDCHRASGIIPVSARQILRFCLRMAAETGGMNGNTESGTSV